MVHTEYLWFNTKQRREMIRITDEIAEIVRKSAVKEGMVLVSAMHITAAVYVNDWEEGLISDFETWLEKLAPAKPDYRHHQTGEDNAEARSRAMGAGLLCGIRRSAPQTRGRQGDGRKIRSVAQVFRPAQYDERPPGSHSRFLPRI
jgi:secondary thiamine-phosphate synthase enzyme